MSKICSIISFLVLVLFASLGAFDAAVSEEEPRIRPYTDKNAIFIGDRITYSIELSSRNEIEAQFPEFKEGVIGTFEVKDTVNIPARKAVFGLRVYSRGYVITTYAVGDQTIPSVTIRYRQRGAGEWISKELSSIPIKVESVLPKDGGAKDIKDIKGPITLAGIPWRLAAFAALIAAIFLIIAAIRKALVKRAPPRPPHELALEELGRIRNAFSQDADVKEYYILICDCIRQYIETIFKLKAPEMTTEEFLSSLKNSAALSLTHKAPLKQFLEACDLVKFAKYAPRKDEIESVCVTARNFVEDTKEMSLATLPKTQKSKRRKSSAC